MFRPNPAPLRVLWVVGDGGGTWGAHGRKVALPPCQAAPLGCSATTLGACANLGGEFTRGVRRPAGFWGRPGRRGGRRAAHHLPAETYLHVSKSLSNLARTMLLACSLLLSIVPHITTSPRTQNAGAASTLPLALPLTLSLPLR